MTSKDNSNDNQQQEQMGWPRDRSSLPFGTACPGGFPVSVLPPRGLRRPQHPLAAVAAVAAVVAVAVVTRVPGAAGRNSCNRPDLQ